MSTRVLVTAGFTMPKVGIVHPVSKTGAMPMGASSLPSWSKHTVTILYVPSLSMSRRPPECSGEEDPADKSESAEKPMPPFRCICSWSMAFPR